jgi:putative colanic acid biosynthesis UDP-glucose lipid carrier transferase
MQDAVDRSSAKIELMLRLSDPVLLWIAGQLAYTIRFGTDAASMPNSYSALLYLEGFLAYLAFPDFGVYRPWRGRHLDSTIVRLALSWAAFLAIGVSVGFAFHITGELSRLWLGFWYGAGLLCLITSRLICFKIIQILTINGLYGKKVMIIGYGTIGQELHHCAIENPWYGYDVSAIYMGAANASLRCERRQPEILTSLDALGDYVQSHGISEVWVTLSFSEVAQLVSLRNQLRNTLIDVRLIPDVDHVEILSKKMVHFLGYPTIDLNRPEITGVRAILKDLFDRLFAALALVGLSPLLFAIAIAVKITSPGPVIFRQRRLGLNGRVFDLYKFRSMRNDIPDNAKQATSDDPRVTPLGRFLRRTSLDELPQFFNVLLGDMSIVGPRPHAMQHNELYTKKLELYMLRHRVKPGITGWAQINGFRGETDTDDKMAMRVQYDIHYIKNWSFWLDLKIILLTGIKGWSGANAY